MNTIEERLWSYIDGTCSADERKAIDILLDQDEAYRAKFEELLSFDQQLSKMEADEPSMGFTFKVMEGIREEYAREPLKAGINKKVIRVIGGFFIVLIVGMLTLTLSTLHLTPVSISVHLPDSLNLPGIKSFLSGPVFQGFIFFDVVLALFLVDTYLRRKRLSKQV